MRGALLLTVAAVVAKVLSAIYRIPFQNLVGDQGFYVFQQVYPFAAVFIVLTSSGLAVAISKLLIDEQEYMKRQQMKKTIFSFLVLLGLLFFVVLFFGATKFGAWMGDKELTPLIRIAAFVALTMPFIAVLKGSYQAQNDMKRIALAQLLEQGCRVAVILGGTFIVLQMTSSIYIAGKVAIFGIVFGAVGSCLYLLLIDRKNSMSFLITPGRFFDWRIIKNVTAYSISISMSSLIVIYFQFVDAFTIFSGLQNTGLSTDVAMTMKGIYDRGQSLVQFSMVLVSALAMAIVPLVAYKSQKGEKYALPYVQLTFRVTFMLSLAAAIGLALVMPYANQMLFETDALSGMLSVYVLQIIPLCFVLTFTAILQGYGKLLWPTLFIVLAVVVKMALNSLFIGQWGIIGAAHATNIALLLSATCFILYIKKWHAMKLANIRYYSKLVVATVCMIVAVSIVEWLLPTTELDRMQAAINAFILIVVGATTFITIVAKSRVLSVREWFLLPGGKYIAALQLYLTKKK